MRRSSEAMNSGGRAESELIQKTFTVRNSNALNVHIKHTHTNVNKLIWPGESDSKTDCKSLTAAAHES